MAEPQQDQPNQERQKPRESAVPASREQYGISGAEELARLENDVKKLEDRPVDDPERMVAEKRRELFLNEHDNAGAFKFKRMGREVQDFFDPKKEPRVVEMDSETGRFSLAESEKNRRLLFVNMGELDRLNKEGGGHGAGDVALQETAKLIERVVHETLKDKRGKETGYTLLRFTGNEFSVSFDDISVEDFERIQQIISGDLGGDEEAKRYGGLLESFRENIKQKTGVSEMPPLVANGFDFEETIDIMNQMQLELDPSERVAADDPAGAARELVEVMKKRAFYSLDVDKFSSRVGRVRDKLATDGKEAAGKFFDNYMAKMFKGTELDSLDKFADLTDEDIDAKALAFAKDKLSAGVDFEEAKKGIVAARVKEIREKRASVAVEGPPAAESGPKKIATIPELTRGQRRLKELEAAAERAEKSGDENAAEIARLDLQIETARRDQGTGLLERGVHYESLEKAFKEGKEASMVFVDMGFLKYFDQKGGTDVGDAALKKAADLMEDAIAAAGVKGEAFRYGGDEYTVKINGGATEVTKFQKALAALVKEAGAIPAGKRGTKDGYFPTELVFNYGTADTAIANDVFEGLKEAGKLKEEDLADPDRVANLKADIMTTIADKAIEEDKAVNRFLMLVDMLRDPQYKANPERATQTEHLVNFSNKAIFAEAGGGELLRRLAQSEKGTAEMMAELKTWVTERIKEAQVKDGKKVDLMSQLIEVHGKIKFYEGKLAEARKTSKDEAALNKKIMAEIEQVRQERDQLINVRKTIQGLDKAA